MPHDSDVQPTSHDRHDAMLVAALAAGDLAATDRDQAISLTATCPDCATLRDDLVAIARATTVVPPPISAHNRDFRLTPADAARLRPGGWRRLVAAFSVPRLAMTRPLGVGLTTLGLVGLLIGNAPLNLGNPAGAGRSSTEAADARAFGAASAPAAGSAASAMAAASAPAASSNSEVSPISAPAASSGPASVVPDAATSGSSQAPGGVDIQGEPGDTSRENGGKASPADRDLAMADQQTVPAASNDPFRPINLLFIAAVILGLGLLVVSRVRIRSRT
ncbi:MAG: hypothetical protein H0U52_03720 [Chloroflexi bacterium]|nr:hypothetical protein [Chloroflexota bacterium]